MERVDTELLQIRHHDGIAPQAHRVQEGEPFAALEVAQPDRSLDEITLFEQHMAVDPRQAACINGWRGPLSAQLDGDIGDR